MSGPSLENEFAKAADLYTDAIAHNPLDATFFCNRAYARMKLEEHGYAINDCSAYTQVFSPFLLATAHKFNKSFTFYVHLELYAYTLVYDAHARTFSTHVAKALELDPKYVKAYYRRALCNLQTLKPQVAVKDFKKVLELDPKNNIARQQLTETQKMIRKAEFEKVSVDCSCGCDLAVYAS